MNCFLKGNLIKKISLVPWRSWLTQEFAKLPFAGSSPAGTSTPIAYFYSYRLKFVTSWLKSSGISKSGRSLPLL